MEKGGAERVISNLCNEYFVQKYKISIVTYLPTICSYDLDKRIQVYSLGILPKRNSISKFVQCGYANQQYLKLMSAIRPDVILAFLPRPCMVACAMRKKLGVPVIGSERSNPAFNFKNPVYRMIAKALYDRADGFVFQTGQARDFFHKKLQRKSVVIMNPINEAAVRSPYGGERSKRIVSVGRFTEEKNYPMLLRAFAGLDPPCQEYMLWIYGRYNEQLRIKEMAVEAGIADRVVFAGQTDTLFDDIYDASLFVMSSRSEGMPNALMEAMAMGIPVIATDCPSGGPRELIQDRVNGRLVPNEDEEALIKAMNEMLSDKKKAMQMAEKAQDITIKCSGQKIFGEWERYILSVLNRRRSKRKISEKEE